MKPYQFDPRTKTYAVRDSYGNTVYRRSRIAAGMTATNARHKDNKNPKPHVLSLMVKGHCIKGAGLTFLTRGIRTPCPCCKQPIIRYALNDAGKRRLAQLRRKRNAY